MEQRVGHEDARTKEAFIQEFERARRLIFQSIEGLTGHDLQLVAINGWSVKDILAHVIEWDHSAVKNAQALIEGGEVDFSPDEDNDSFNEEARAKYRHAEPAFVIRLLGTSSSEVIKFLKSVDEKDLFMDSGKKFGDEAITPVWFLDDVGHDIDHANEIREWRTREGK